MKTFGFWRDELFQAGCGAYALNRWVVKPHCRSAFLHGYFNDLWLIPCALPILLFFHRRLGLRPDSPPTLGEVASHLVFWSFLFEWLGPRLMPNVTGDPLDVVCYWAGGLVAWAWWNRATLRSNLFPTCRTHEL